MSWTLFAFYKFIELPGFETLRDPLLRFCEERGICGSVLLAREGVNGTVAGSPEAIAAFQAYLSEEWAMGTMDGKFAAADQKPFRKTKVKLKSEIVRLGRPDLNPAACPVGHYVEAKDWNRLIADPDVRVIDTRNDFEYQVGTFARAENPRTAKFSDFPGYAAKELDPVRDKKVAMFCTGGIRCEKASALLLERGFSEVYHLKGGILKYFEEVPEEESLWRGECFVFDDRVTVDQNLAPGKTGCCRGCWNPLRPEDKLDPRYVEGVCCPVCVEEKKPERIAAARGRERGVLIVPGVLCDAVLRALWEAGVQCGDQVCRLQVMEAPAVYTHQKGHP